MAIDLLEQAMDKISKNMLDNMVKGETISLNKRFELYQYLDGESFTLTDKKYDEQTISVQYGNGEEIVFTDVYGYDDNENFDN
tara:strand:- start:3102 stop:3350 length:249 start_codon:yes stop_codon:yes gene_type:complete